MMKFIKIGLAGLLFICLINMPYGYYQFVRFIAFVVFAVLAYLSYESQKNVMFILYGALAFLFQPFFKVALGKEIWNIVDVVVGVGLVLSVFFQSNFDKSNQD